MDLGMQNPAVIIRPTVLVSMAAIYLVGSGVFSQDAISTSKEVAELFRSVDSLGAQRTCGPTNTSERLFPPQKYLSDTEVPPKIALAATAVVQICACIVRSDTCLTGFRVSESGLFLTNQHVVEGSDRMKRDYEMEQNQPCPGLFSISNTKPSIEKVQDWDKLKMSLDKEAIPITVEVVKRGALGQIGFKGQVNDNDDNGKDVALIRIPELKAGHFISIGADPGIGDHVYLAGFPSRKWLDVPGFFYMPRVSVGQVRSKTDTKYTASCLGSPGVSGGPVLNASGELVGVFWGKEVSFRESLLSFKQMQQLTEGSLRVPEERSYFAPIQRINEFLEGTPIQSKR